MFVNIIFVKILVDILILASAKIPCDPDSFQFVNPPKVVRYQGSYTIKVQNLGEIGCSINVLYRWEALSFERNMLKIMQSDVFLKGNLTKTKSNILNFQNVKEDIFEKTFVIRVTLIPPVTHFPSFRLHYLTVLEENYKFEIGGGNFRTHYLGDGSLILTVLASRESGKPMIIEKVIWQCSPSFKVYTSNKRTYKIYEHVLEVGNVHNCSATVRVSDYRNLTDWQIIDIKEGKDTPMIDVVCEINCFNGNASQATKVKYVCHSSCEGLADWSVFPYSKDIVDKFVIIKPSSLMIPGNTFKPGDSFKITLSFGAAMGNLTINFDLPLDPIYIKCIKNCFIQGEDITLQAVCPYGFKNIGFEWEIHTIPQFHNLLATQKYTETDTLTIDADFLLGRKGAHVYVRNYGASSIISFTIDKVEPILVIECVPNCDPFSRINPSYALAIYVRCLSFCKSIKGYYWHLTPVSFDISWWKYASEGNKSIIFPPNIFIDKWHIVVTVFPIGIGAPTDKFIRFDYVLNFKIICVSNCPDTNGLGYAEFYVPTIYKASCLDGLCYNVPLHWVFITDPITAVNTHEQKHIVVNNNETLIIPAYYFKPSINLLHIFLKSHVAQIRKTVPFQITKVKLGIKCVKNCFRPNDPSSDLILHGFCKEDCRSTSLFWEIANFDNRKIYWHDKFDLSYLNKTLTIKKNSYKSDDVVIVYLKSEGAHLKATYIVVYKTTFPSVVLVCLTNCEETKSNKEIIIDVRCLEHCQNFVSNNFQFNFNPSVSSKELINVNFEITSDGDVHLIIPPNVIFYSTMVTVDAGGSMASIVLHVSNVMSYFVLSCQPEPCNYSHSIRDIVTINATCYNECYEPPFEWFIKPLPPNFVWDKHIVRLNKNTTLQILPKAFNHLDTINVTVTDGDIEGSVTISFIEPEPEFRVICVKNCNHSEPHADVHLEAQCFWRCEFVKQFKWTLTPPVDDFSVQVAMEPDNLSIIIKRNSYKDGDYVMVRASWSAYSKTLSLNFVEKSLRLKIKCLKNCIYSKYNETIFHLECLGNCICSHNIIWMITKGVKPVLYYDNNKTIIISDNTYINYQAVNVTACQYKSCVTIIAKFEPLQYQLKIVNEDIETDNNFLNALLQSSFQVICNANCTPNMKYTWRVEPKPFTFEKRRDYLIAKDTDIITFRHSLFKNGSCVKIFASIDETEIYTKACFFIYQPILRITCLLNCGYPDPLLATMYHISCFKNCENLIFHWKLTPQPLFEPLIDFYTMKILRQSYRDEDVVTITVFTKFTQVHRVIKFAEQPPLLVLKCHHCHHLNPHENVNISVDCSANCYEGLPFIWDINPKGKNFVWIVNITLYDNNKTMEILKETYESNSIVVVSVATIKGSVVRKQLYFVDPNISVKLHCRENCEYDPKRIVLIRVECKNCTLHNIKPQCFIDHQPVNISKFQNNSGIVLIEENAYEPDTLVGVECRAKNSTDQLEILFKDPVSGTSCEIIPFVGVSGVTKHTIDCMRLEANATYQIFVYVPGLNGDVPVRLYSGLDPFERELYLPQGLVHLLILGRVKKILKLTSLANALSSPLLTVYNLTVLQENVQTYRSLIDKGKFQRALNLALVIDGELRNVSASLRTAVREIIMLDLFKITTVIEPFPVIALISVIASNTTDHNVLNTIMELTYLSCHSILYWDLLINSETIYLKVGNIIFEIIDYVLTDSYLLKTHFDSSGEEKFATTEYIAGVLKRTTMSLLRTSDCALELLEKQGDTSWSDENISYIIKSTNKTEQAFTLKVSNSESFIDIFPTTFFTQEFQVLSFKMGVYKENILWWVEPINAEIISFVAETGDRRSHSGAFRVGIILNEKKSYTFIETTLESNELAVWRVDVAVNFTLEVLFLADFAKISVTTSKPHKTFVKEKGTVQKKMYKVAANSPLYIGLIGSGNVTLYLTSVACYTWHGSSWEWGTEGCHVSSVQNRENMLLCDCHMLSLFTADLKPVNASQVQTRKPPSFPEVRKNIQLIRAWSIAMCIFMLVLLILVILKDKQWRQTNIVVYLFDNDPANSEIYLIGVQTGFWRGSGTTSKVVIQIFGSKSQSQPHLLHIYEHLFQRNSTDVFLLLTSKHLGEITHIGLWHDSYGSQPEWFCDNIVIKNMATHERYIFEISRWFSLVREPWNTFGFFKPTPKHVSISLRFKESLRTYFSFASIWTARSDGYILIKCAILLTVEVLMIMAMAAYMLAGSEVTYQHILNNVFLIVFISTVFSEIIDYVIINTLL